MKKLSITFGNGIYFCYFPTDPEVVHVSTFEQAWWTRDTNQIQVTLGQIITRLSYAQLSVVAHEPVPFVTQEEAKVI